MPDDQVLVTKPHVEICQLANYMAAIRGSVGSHMFRHLPALVDGAAQDIVQGGEIACAYFASWVLYHFRLIREPHATVTGLVDALVLRSGWTRCNPKHRVLGAVIEWEQEAGESGEAHGHVGFCTGPYTAISHCSAPKRYPDEHNIIGHPYRAVKAVYTHPFLFGH